MTFFKDKIANISEWFEFEKEWCFKYVNSHLFFKYKNYIIKEISPKSEKRNEFIEKFYDQEIFEKIEGDFINDSEDNTISIGVYLVEDNFEFNNKEKLINIDNSNNLTLTLSLKNRGNIINIISNFEKIFESFSNEFLLNIDNLTSFILEVDKIKGQKFANDLILIKNSISNFPYNENILSDFDKFKKKLSPFIEEKNLDKELNLLRLIESVNKNLIEKFEDIKNLNELFSFFLKFEEKEKNCLFFEFSRFVSMNNIKVNLILPKIFTFFMLIIDLKSNSQNINWEKIRFFSNSSEKHSKFYQRLFKKIISKKSKNLHINNYLENNFIIYKNPLEFEEIYENFEKILNSTNNKN